MTNLDQDWVNNRSQKRIAKIRRWLVNPVGALSRVIEMLYFKSTLFLLVKGYGDITEIEHLSKKLDKNKDSIDFQYFSEVRVSLPNRLILLDTGHISAPDHSSHSFLSGNLWAEIRKLQRTRNPKTFERCIPMPTPGYYYHFLIDDVPSMLQTLKKNPSYKVLFYGSLPSYVDQIMKALSIKYDTSPDSIVNIRDLLLPKKKQRYMHEFRMELNRLLLLNPELNTKTDGKLFIGRSNLPRGNKSFEEELFKHLSSMGFKSINPEELSFTQQVQEFATAKTIVALHGGALSNIVFCSPGTTVYEVFNHKYRTYPFSRISEELGLNYRAFEASNPGGLIDQLRSEM